MVLYQIFVVSAWLTFVFFMLVSVSGTEKKIEKTVGGEVIQS